MNPLDHLLDAADSYVKQAHLGLDDANNAFKAILAHDELGETFEICPECGEIVEIEGHGLDCPTRKEHKESDEFLVDDEGLAAAHSMNGDQLPVKDESLSDDLSLNDAISASAILQRMEMFESLAKDSKKTDSKAKVRNRGDVVFPAESSKTKDDKDHFPINNENQARNALSQAGKYTTAPPWYNGSLKSLVDAVKRKVHSKYKGIEVSKSNKKIIKKL